MRDLVFFYGAAAVGDRDQAAVFFVRETDPDPLAVAVLDGVFEKVLQDFLEAVTVGGKKDIRVFADCKVRAQGCELFVVEDLDAVHDFLEIYFAHRDFEIEEILLRCGDDISDILLDFRGIVRDAVDGLLALFLGVVDALVECAGIELDGGKRRLDIVGKREDQRLLIFLEFELALLICLEIVAEHVDAPEEFAEEFALLFIDRGREVASREIDGELAHRVERTKDLFGDIDEDHDRDQKRETKADVHVDQGADVRLDLVFEADERAEDLLDCVVIVDDFAGVEGGDAENRRVFFHIKIQARIGLRIAAADVDFHRLFTA